VTLTDLRRAYCAHISTDPDSIPGRRIMAGDSDNAPGALDLAPAGTAS